MKNTPELRLSFIVVVIVTATFLLSSTAQAYIPSSKTIASRVVRNNGKGPYVVEQDVQFRTGTETATIRERWIIENGENMRLSVNAVAGGLPARFDAVYRDGKRTSPDFNGGVHTLNVSTEFTECYSHTRTSADLLRSLVRANILPASFLKDRARFTIAREAQATKADLAGEPHVRLGRTGGVVNYVFGDPTPVDANKALPGAWIEEDAFVLRRLRFPSQSEITFDQYGLQAGTIRFPSQRVVTWSDHTAVIRLISIRSADSKAAATALNVASITSADGKAAKLPDQTQVKEFYSRFR